MAYLDQKMELAIELVNFMYDKKLITDAYIIGSLANGNARGDSDIDIYIVNPGFLPCSYLGKPEERIRVEENDERKLGEELLKIGVEWIKLDVCNGCYFYHQIYNDQAFHLMTYSDISDLDDKRNNIRITRKINS